LLRGDKSVTQEEKNVLEIKAKALDKGGDFSKTPNICKVG
jgi:hypothetical protein